MNAINTTSNSVRSAAYFTVDHFKHQIIGNEQNFKKSGIIGSAQYDALMNAMAAHPTYTLTVKTSEKKVEKKQTYNCLTTDLMREYVKIKGTPAQLEELDNLIDNNEAYPTIKSWFLDYFKCGFTVEKAKSVIAHHKLNARKAKIRAVVRAKSVKVAPIEAEVPAVINF